ncbi:DotU family type IV/VI secretion system protein [Enterobacteriaceae bacterium RIT711]|nr:DotU family type IV/VI secretion system protein [Enterobacteriaceae bacterium RIT711]
MELLDFYLPVFKLVLQMTGEPNKFGDYDETRQTCIVLLEQAINNAGQLEVSEEEKEAACIAVITWLDETILRSSLPWCQRWQSELLQRKYLNFTVGGERFFTQLTQLSPSQKQARIVFLFCLQNGFRGQYTTPNDLDALQTLIVEQRSLCLPEICQIWPNDAPITSSICVSRATILHPLRHLFFMAVGVSLLYGLFFYFLYYYVS